MAKVVKPIINPFNDLYQGITSFGEGRRKFYGLNPKNVYSERNNFIYSLGSAADWLGRTSLYEYDEAGRDSNQLVRNADFYRCKQQIQLNGWVQKPLTNVETLGTEFWDTSTQEFGGKSNLRNLISRAGPVLPFAYVHEDFAPIADAKNGLHPWNTTLKANDPLSASFALSLLHPQGNANLIKQQVELAHANNPSKVSDFDRQYAGRVRTGMIHSLNNHYNPPPASGGGGNGGGGGGGGGGGSRRPPREDDDESIASSTDEYQSVKSGGSHRRGGEPPGEIHINLPEVPTHLPETGQTIPTVQTLFQTADRPTANAQRVGVVNGASSEIPLGAAHARNPMVHLARPMTQVGTGIFNHGEETKASEEVPRSMGTANFLPKGAETFEEMSKNKFQKALFTQTRDKIPADLVRVFKGDFDEATKQRIISSFSPEVFQEYKKRYDQRVAASVIQQDTLNVTNDVITMNASNTAENPYDSKPVFSKETNGTNVEQMRAEHLTGLFDMNGKLAATTNANIRQANSRKGILPAGHAPSKNLPSAHPSDVSKGDPVYPASDTSTLKNFQNIPSVQGSINRPGTIYSQVSHLSGMMHDTAKPRPDFINKGRGRGAHEQYDAAQKAFEQQQKSGNIENGIPVEPAVFNSNIRTGADYQNNSTEKVNKMAESIKTKEPENKQVEQKGNPTEKIVLGVGKTTNHKTIISDEKGNVSTITGKDDPLVHNYVSGSRKFSKKAEAELMMDASATDPGLLYTKQKRSTPLTLEELLELEDMAEEYNRAQLELTLQARKQYEIERNLNRERLPDTYYPANISGVAKTRLERKGVIDFEAEKEYQHHHKNITKKTGRSKIERNKRVLAHRFPSIVSERLSELTGRKKTHNI